MVVAIVRSRMNVKWSRTALLQFLEKWHAGLHGNLAGLDELKLSSVFRILIGRQRNADMSSGPLLRELLTGTPSHDVLRVELLLGSGYVCPHCVRKDRVSILKMQQQKSRNV